MLEELLVEANDGDLEDNEKDEERCECPVKHAPQGETIAGRREESCSHGSENHEQPHEHVAGHAVRTLECRNAHLHQSGNLRRTE